MFGIGGTASGSHRHVTKIEMWTSREREDVSLDDGDDKDEDEARAATKAISLRSGANHCIEAAHQNLQ